MDDLKAEVERLMAGSGREVNQAYLMGPGGWNEFQAGVLDDIPVTLIGGDRFAAPAGAGPANPSVWPNDGIVGAVQRAWPSTSATGCCRTGVA